MFEYEYVPEPLTPAQIEREVTDLITRDREISSLLGKTKTQVKIRDCGRGIRALYNIKKREIWVSDKDVEPGTLKEILLHECIHSFDHNVKKINIGTIEGLARTEVHAMKRCECRGAWLRRLCTRNKAIKAVALSVGDYDKAAKAVNEIFEDAYNDDIVNFL